MITDQLHEFSMITLEVISETGPHLAPVPSRFLRRRVTIRKWLPILPANMGALPGAAPRHG